MVGIKVRIGCSGGEGGIRTLGRAFGPSHDFQSCTFDHSVTSPLTYFSVAEGLGLEPRRAAMPFTGFQDRLLANSDIPPISCLYYIQFFTQRQYSGKGTFEDFYGQIL